MPPDYLYGIGLLGMAAAMVLVFDLVAGPRLPAQAMGAHRRYAGTREAFVALAFCAVVGLFCVLDLTLFPVPLWSDPGSYAQMDGGCEHIRHLSAWCWVFPLVGLLCARQRWLCYGLVAVGVLSQILFIERNRIFALLFALGHVLL